jgi:hypothetical protein
VSARPHWYERVERTDAHAAFVLARCDAVVVVTERVGTDRSLPTQMRMLLVAQAL